MNIRALTIGFFAADVALIAASAWLYLQLDRQAPVITLPETAVEYSDGMDEKELLEGVTAYDNRDGDVTGSLLIEKISETPGGEVIVTYAAVDGANNVAEKARILQRK